MKEVDLRGFARAMVDMVYEAGDLDITEVMDCMEKHGLLLAVEFDPSKHTDPEGDAELGDPWYEIAPSLKRRGA